MSETDIFTAILCHFLTYTTHKLCHFLTYFAPKLCQFLTHCSPLSYVIFWQYAPLYCVIFWHISPSDSVSFWQYALRATQNRPVPFNAQNSNFSMFLTELKILYVPRALQNLVCSLHINNEGPHVVFTGSRLLKIRKTCRPFSLLDFRGILRFVNHFSIPNSLCPSTPKML